MNQAAISSQTATSSVRNTMVIIQALRARGIDADAVLAEAGVDPQIGQSIDSRVPFEVEDKLFRLVVERTGDPSVGIDLVEYMNPTVYDALGVALLCSSTLRDFFRRFERFFDVVSTLESAEFHETDYGGCFSDQPNVQYSELTRGCHADAFCAVVLKFMRLVYRPDYSPKCVDLAWLPPEQYHDKYHRHFGCQVNFSAPMTAVHVNAEDLDMPLAGANARLAFQSDQLASEIQAKLKRDDLRSVVYARLLEYLPAGDCSREKVAHSLHMSESAFQKKLKEQGTTYQQLLDATRQELAEHYLSSGGMSISETAFLLGFTDSSNFSRAFKRWVGVSPSDFKER